MVRILTVSVGALIAAAACATAPADGPASSRNVITAEEIAPLPITNAYDAIVRLRPHFLQQRQSGISLQPRAEGRSTIVVYVDGIRMGGGPDALTDIGALTVEEIRFLNSSQATQAYGTGHHLGAILVTTRR